MSPAAQQSMEQRDQLNLRLHDLCELSSSNVMLNKWESRRSSTSSSQDTTTRNLEHILNAAQQQQLRQLRRLQQLKRQAESTAAHQAAIEAKEKAEAERKARRAAELAQEAACRAEQAAAAEERRRSVQEAAARQQEEVRAKLEAKLARMKPRVDRALLETGRRMSAAKSAARMRQTLQRKEQVLEERRQAILAAEAAAAARMQQKQELRMLQDAIKREENYLAEQRRQDTQARAEADEDARVSYYQEKQEQREARLQQRQQQADLLRMLRAEEAQARFQYIRHRAAEVGQQDRACREELAHKLEAKMQRADVLAEERAALTNLMRNTLISNELKFKELMERAKVSDGLELQQVMQQLQDGISYATALSGSSGSSTRRSSLSSSRLPRSTSASCSHWREQPSLPDSRSKGTMGVGPSTSTAAPSSSTQEAVLQRILEQEILREIDREAALREAADPEERLRLLKAFDGEREAAKARILEIGQQLMSQQDAQQ